jgi:hypothetical protein
MRVCFISVLEATNPTAAAAAAGLLPPPQLLTNKFSHLCNISKQGQCSMPTICTLRHL